MAAAFVIDHFTREMQNDKKYPWKNYGGYNTGQHHHQPYMLGIIIKAVIIVESQKNDPHPKTQNEMNDK
jgi:hypothetical protein